MKKKNGLTGAVISALCIILYYGAMLVLFALIPGIPWWGKLLLGLLPLAVCATVIGVLVQRVRELKSGETDDLDKY